MIEGKLKPLPGPLGAQPPRSGRMPGYRPYNLLFVLTFLAFMVFRNVDGGNRVDILATIRLEFLLGGAAIAMAMVKISQQPVDMSRSRYIIGCICLLFCAMIVQLPLAVDPAEAQRVFTDRVFKFAMLTFLIAAFVESPTTLRMLIGAFLFSIFYVTLEATQGLISGSLVWQNQGVMRLHGAVPMYGHPNSLSGAAMGTLPFVIFLLIPARRWFIRLFMLAGVTTALACVIYSGSRTGYVGLVSLGAWWHFQSGRKIRFAAIAAIVLAVSLSLVPDQYIARFESIGTGKEAEGHSEETRKVIIQDALIILQEHPFGIGVASFPAARTARFGRSQDTHNLYLEVATNLGIQGLVVFMGLVGVLLASLRRSALAFRSQHVNLLRLTRYRRLPPNVSKHLERHDQDLTFCLGAAQATAGFVVVRLTLGLFGMDLYEIYWWFASGVAIALAGLVVTTYKRTRFFLELVTHEE